MMRTRAKQLVFGAVLLATMIGVAPSPADASTSSRLRVLEKKTKRQAAAITILKDQVASQHRQLLYLGKAVEDLIQDQQTVATLAYNTGVQAAQFQACFSVVSTGFTVFTPPGLVDPIVAFTVVSPGTAWVAVVDSSCVDPGTPLRGPRLRVAS